MTKTPAKQSEAADKAEPELSMQQQIDQLIMQIETEEPGTLDPAVLPEGFQSPAKAAQAAKAKPAPPKQPAAAQDDQALAEAVADFEEALDPQAQADAASKPTEGAPPPAELAPAAAVAQEQTPAYAAEADMLAQLNAALQDLNPGSGAAPAASDAAPATAPAAESPAKAENESLSNDDLQAQINALLNGGPEPEATAEPEPANPARAERAAAVEAEQSTQDQIADEIQNLLESDQQADTAPQPGDPSIDELDRMLSDEIEEDEELAGDFESVETITAGIDGQDSGETLEVDEHAAQANDVAAELDSQPETLAGASADDEDPDAVLSEIAKTVELNAKAAEQEMRDAKSWLKKAERLRERLLHACFAINWPARQFLSAEHRANLGYIALLNLFGAAAVWLYLIFF